MIKKIDVIKMFWKAKLIKVGNSNMVTVPSEFVNNMDKDDTHRFCVEIKQKEVSE